MNGMSEMLNSASRKSAMFDESVMRYVLSSVIAGLLISFGSFVSMSCGGLCVGTIGAASKLVTAFAFASALSLVVVAGGELFTGNNMVLGTACLARRISIDNCVSMCVWCAAGNYIGSWIGIVLYHLSGADTANASVVAYTASVASAKCHLSAFAMVVRGVLCNALVCLAIWCSFCLKSEAAKLVMIFWCIFVFMVCGFEHSIANMSIIGMALVGNHPIDFGYVEYLKNIYCVMFGNVIGGLALVGIPYYIVTSCGGVKK